MIKVRVTKQCSNIILLGRYDSVFRLVDYDFILAPGGKASRYKYRLQAKALGVIIFFGDFFSTEESYLEEGKGKCKYEISPNLIEKEGIQKVIYLISHFNQNLMFSFFPSGCDFHLCQELQGWSPQADLINDMVTMATSKVSYNGISESGNNGSTHAIKYGDNDSFLFGRANSSQLAIYNKTKESEFKGNKTFWNEVYSSKSVSYNPLSTVFRVELRLPHTVIKNLVKRDDGSSLELLDIESCLDHLNSLWRYGLSRLFRYDYPSTCKDKKTIQPIWQFLLQDVYLIDVFFPINYKREYVTVDDSIDRNITILMGNLTTVLAKAGVSNEQMIETVRNAPFYKQLLAYARDKKELNENNYIEYLLDIYQKKKIEYDQKALISSESFKAYRRSYLPNKDLDYADMAY